MSYESLRKPLAKDRYICFFFEFCNGNRNIDLISMKVFVKSSKVDQELEYEIQ
jgi:hypothetical protein